MKKLYLGILYAVSFINIVPIAAMQTEPSYPWYQAYKRPEMQERVSRGLQSAKEFAQRHKIKLIVAGIIAAILAGTATVSLKLRSNIIKIYNKHDFNMAELKKTNRKDYEQLVQLGVHLYGYRLMPFDARGRQAFISEVMKKIEENDKLRHLVSRYQNLEEAFVDILGWPIEEPSAEEEIA